MLKFLYSSVLASTNEHTLNILKLNHNMNFHGLASALLSGLDFAKCKKFLLNFISTVEHNFGDKLNVC
ncbi:hypothetical protein QE152_g23069 [Popillia japonica]|uniref:Uncharacterized protein n=1 Tax=Popillia japonica TaxID=7064 RepID=A0AAW1KIE1_POPJA